MIVMVSGMGSMNEAQIWNSRAAGSFHLHIVLTLSLTVCGPGPSRTKPPNINEYLLALIQLIYGCLKLMTDELT